MDTKKKESTPSVILFFPDRKTLLGFRIFFTLLKYISFTEYTRNHSLTHAFLLLLLLLVCLSNVVFTLVFVFVCMYFPIQQQKEKKNVL